MSEENAPTSVSPLVLPPIVDLAYAATLKSILVDALNLGTGIDIDAGEVQRITTPCLQILAAAAKSFGESRGPPLLISKAAPVVSEAFKTLSIDCVLNAKGE